MSRPAPFWVLLGLGGLALGWPLAQPSTNSPPQLTILSQPSSAEVWWDGSYQGLTPLRLATQAGPHSLDLRHSDCISHKENVVLKDAAESYHVQLEPRWASLSLKNSEKAKIHLGPGPGQPLKGRGPWKLRPGNYEIVAQRGPLPAKPEKFSLKPGQALQLGLRWPSPPQPPRPRLPRLEEVRSSSPPSRPLQSFEEERPVYQPRYVEPARPSYYEPPRYQPPPPEPVFTPIPASEPEPAGPLFTPLP